MELMNTSKQAFGTFSDFIMEHGIAALNNKP